MKNYLCTSIFVFLAGLSASAQTLKAFEREARKALEAKDYATALNYYQQALDIDSTRLENVYQAAHAAREFNALSIAERNYQRVVTASTQDAYKLARYYLAVVQKGRGNYQEAISNFRTFITTNQGATDIASAILEDAQRQIPECERAQRIVESALDYVKLVNLRGINTPDSEFAGFPEAGKLYYGSLYFQREKDSYSAAQAALQAFETPNMDTSFAVSFLGKNQIHTAFNPKKNRVYFTVCEFRKAGDYRCDLYYLQKDDLGKWEAAQRLPDFINQPNVSSTQPSVGVTEKGDELLFFASDRPGGKGKMDLYYIKVLANNEFSQPVPLTDLNTPEDDVTPFFHTASQTLFFSTDGRPSLGKLDIYESTWKNGIWSEPEALGYPLNSSYNDTYYFLNEVGDTAYFSSNRAGGVVSEDDAYETCCTDIYQAVFDIDVELVVKSNCTSTFALDGVDYQLTHAQDNSPVQRNPLNNSFTLKPGRIYELFAQKTGFSPASTTVSTKGIFKPTTISTEMTLAPKDNLEILVFDAVRKQPLRGARVQLYKAEELLYEIQLRENEHSFFYTVEPNTSYRLVASRIEYIADTLEFKTDNLNDFCSGIKKEIYLNDEIPTYLPITLYFDNDQPVPRSWAVTTDSSYTDIFTVYFAKKETFKREYRKGKQFTTASQRDSAAMQVERFFQDSVLVGYERLGLFAESVLKFLERGRQIEVPIQGFASPRATPGYNTNLSKRRIASIKNFFREYRNGIFIPYINNRSLQFKEDPSGEDDDRTRKQHALLENLDDRANTIYSPPASEGRRIQITQLNFLDTETSSTQN